MAVGLADKTEAGTHTNPVVVFAVLVQLLHHVAKAVVGGTLERGVLAYLLRGLIDDLRETWHLLDADINGSE